MTTSQPRAEAYSGRAEQQLYDAYVEAFGNPPKAVKRPNSVEMEYMVDIGKFKPHKGSPTADDIKKAMEEGYEGIISNYGDRDEMELAVFTNKPLKRIKEVVV